MKLKYEEKICTINKPQHEPFSNPSAITLKEYLKNKKNNDNPKFSPFPDPNGASQDQFDK